MQIAELERRTGVNRHTLRYYEKEGLLPDVERRGNNYRDYPERAVRHVELVRQLKALDFSLKEIRDLLDAIRADRIDCAQGAALMAEKRAAVDARIIQLQQVSAMLAREQQRLAESAEARRQGGQCQT